MKSSVRTLLPAFIFILGLQPSFSDDSPPKKIVPPDRPPEEFVLAADNRGYLMEPRKNGSRVGYHHHLDDGDVAVQVDNYLERLVNAALKGAVTHADGKKHLLIFIHGGLNGHNAAIQNAMERYALIRHGKNNEETYYPVFINWDSALGSSYCDHLLHIRQGLYYNRFDQGALMSPFFLVADVGRAIARTPVSWYERANASAGGQDSVFFSLSELAFRTETAHQKLISENILDATRQSTLTMDQRTRFDRVTSGALYWTTLPVKAVTMPVVDTIGTGAWDVMLTRTAWLFEGRLKMDKSKAIALRERWRHSKLPVNGPVSEAPYKIDPLPGGNEDLSYFSDQNDGLLELFFSKLQCRIKQAGNQHVVTLAGHSMGCIVGNEILRRHPRLPIDNIIYMAAACSIQEAELAVRSYMAGHFQTHFYNLCLHPLRDISETNAWGLAPRGSLLEWLDSTLTNPHAPKERRLGKWGNLVLARRAFSDVSHSSAKTSHYHFKVFPMVSGGHWHAPQKHRDFSSSPFWEASFREPNAPTPR